MSTSAPKPPRVTLEPKKFYDILASEGVGFYAGVPDSLLKEFCAFVTSSVSDSDHIITANEGNAVALASGHYMATGKVPLVYLQNSGLGNTVNPVMSLAHPDVYGIPMVLLVGWRGEPGVKDEPQHIVQGKVTPAMLESMTMPYEILPEDAEKATAVVKKLVQTAKAKMAPVALLVKKDTFSSFKLAPLAPVYQMSREEALEEVLVALEKDAAVVGSTGFPSREIFEIREKHSQSHASDFLTVGSMGHTASIALGVALAKPTRSTYCIEGDGAFLMHMGSVATVGLKNPKNFRHVVVNNAAHDSVGAQPSGMDKINIPGVALSCGYKSASTVSTREELRNAMKNFVKQEGPALLEVKIHTGARKNLGRPTKTTHECKQEFMKFLQE